MELEISLLPFSVFVCTIVLVGLLLKALHQPYVIAYILVGILLGPYGFGLVSDKTFLVQLGSIGILFLLFFVGMELSLPRLLRSWRIAFAGTFLQICFSLMFVYVLGIFNDWALSRIIALGFVISLSSTALVVKHLQDKNMLGTQEGSNVMGVLLVQDLSIVPMMIILSVFSGKGIRPEILISQLLCGVSVASLLLWAACKKSIRLPLTHLMKDDPEMQIFMALFLCFGLSVLTELSHMSAALGAFTAGVLVSAAKETEWVKRSLEPFHVVFVGLFFVSIGMLIDLHFLLEHPMKLLLLMGAVFLTNTFINAAIFRTLGDSWHTSIEAGAMLSQIGELSFLIAALGFRSGILADFSYQMTISVIALTLLFSPVWIRLVDRFLRQRA